MTRQCWRMDGAWRSKSCQAGLNPAQTGADTNTQSARKIRVKIETLVDMNRARMIEQRAEVVTV